jgi:hypothetical protein
MLATKGYTRSDQIYPGQIVLKETTKSRSDNRVGYMATSPDATYQRSGWQLDSVVSELIDGAILFVPPSYCEMDVLKEQRVCMKFYQKLGKTATETYEILQQAFGETALSRSKTFEWYSQFKNGRTSIDDDPHTCRKSMARTNENVDRVNTVIRGNRRLTIREIADELNL